MEGFLCFLVVAGIVGVLVWQWSESRRAVATTVVDTPLPPGEAIQVVQEAFTGARAVLWTRENGPGMINMRRRGAHRGITMSIDVEPRPDGGSEVSMWASRSMVYLGVLVNFAGVVNRRKRPSAGPCPNPSSRDGPSAHLTRGEPMYSRWTRYRSPRIERSSTTRTDSPVHRRRSVSRTASISRGLFVSCAFTWAATPGECPTGFHPAAGSSC